MDNKDFIDDLIVRFFCRETTTLESAKLFKWIRESEEHRVYFMEIRNVFLASLTLSPDYIVSPAASYVLVSHTAEPVVVKLKNHPGLKRRKDNRRPFGYAAAIVVVALFSGALLYKIYDDRRHHAERVPGGMQPIEFNVSFGSRASTSLPDGSKIWVNAGSRISYAADYGAAEREVHLEGEAFFDVATDPDKPFVVKAHGIEITATGTAFNVSAYADDKSVVTTLVHGKVTISGNLLAAPIEMEPNQTVEFFCGEDAYAQMGKSIEKLKVTPSLKNIELIEKSPAIKVDNNPEIYTSWKENRWIVEREPLGSLAEKLERRYNVSIYFTNEDIKNYRFNGAFEDETIDEVMRIIRRTIPVSYKIDKGNVLLFADRELQSVFEDLTEKPQSQ